MAKRAKDFCAMADISYCGCGEGWSMNYDKGDDKAYNAFKDDLVNDSGKATIVSIAIATNSGGANFIMRSCVKTNEHSAEKFAGLGSGSLKKAGASGPTGGGGTDPCSMGKKTLEYTNKFRAE